MQGGVESKFAPVAQKRFDHVNRFRPRDRADGIDQPAAGPHRVGRASQQLRLNPRAIPHIVGRRSPARVRVSGPRAVELGCGLFLE